MNKIKFSAILFALSTIFFFTSCQEEFIENDLIEGKWREEAVVLDADAPECQLLSYVEYSKYVADPQQRIVTKFDSCASSIVKNTYSIKDNILTVVDEKLVTKQYTIELINETKMVYYDKNNKMYSFIRYR
jgi:hypothetical protein